LEPPRCLRVPGSSRAVSFRPGLRRSRTSEEKVEIDRGVRPLRASDAPCNDCRGSRIGHFDRFGLSVRSQRWKSAGQQRRAWRGQRHRPRDPGAFFEELVKSRKPPGQASVLHPLCGPCHHHLERHRYRAHPPVFSCLFTLGVQCHHRLPHRQSLLCVRYISVRPSQVYTGGGGRGDPPDDGRRPAAHGSVGNHPLRQPSDGRYCGDTCP
jgi:hypothetical protein